ncbi:hypothetical protein KC930_01585 [Candidatus Saccharibacteria bacterium]|nr:hypothetical protein [Candidatus Saccharibacteria bacterium]
MFTIPVLCADLEPETIKDRIEQTSRTIVNRGGLHVVYDSENPHFQGKIDQVGVDAEGVLRRVECYFGEGTPLGSLPEGAIIRYYRTEPGQPDSFTTVDAGNSKLLRIVNDGATMSLGINAAGLAIATLVDRYNTISPIGPDCARKITGILRLFNYEPEIT